MKKGILEIALVVLICAFFVSSAEADTTDLWKGLIGEAVSEGYDGMYAVACCYRNRIERGLPLGCVALKRKDLNEFVSRQGKKYETMAKRIIDEVFIHNSPDVTLGADHYEYIEKYGIPAWAGNMQPTIKIGCHTFYKSNATKAAIHPSGREHLVHVS